MSTDLSTAPADDHRVPLPPVGPASGRVLRLVGGLLLIGAGIGLTMLLIGRPSIEDAAVTRTSHDPVEEVLFDLRANGDVEVTTHAGREVLVLERTDSTIREVRTSQEIVGDTLRISSDGCSRWFTLWFDRCSASFEVRVPPDTSVGGSVSHGRSELRGLAGVELEVGHGAIVATGTEGPLQLTTGHGEIQVDDAGANVTVDTGHGHVTVAGAGGDLHVRTGHGRVDLSEVAGDATTVTGHGTVSVRGADGDLDLRSGHGSIEATDSRGGTIQLDTGHGHVAFEPSTSPTSTTITTSHGNVDVRLPRDAPAYAITTDAGSRTADVDVATDPTADHRLELRTGHGRIAVGYADS